MKPNIDLPQSLPQELPPQAALALFDLLYGLTDGIRSLPPSHSPPYSDAVTHPDVKLRQRLQEAPEQARLCAVA